MPSRPLTATTANAVSELFHRALVAGYHVVTPMSQRLSAPARREQILDVALEVFANAGFHGASMNDVADAAGVTKPVLYQHFDSKRDLYQALIAEVGNRLRNNIAKATAEATDGKSTTELGFRAYFRWVAEDHDGFRLLFGSGSRRDDEFNDAVRQITADSAQAIAPLIAVDIDESHRKTLAHALVGLAEGASRRLVELGDEFDPDEIAAEVSALAWAGLRAVSPK
jgi:AcrR family transcriptional regulator